jgi:hypothetical protein
MAEKLILWLKSEAKQMRILRQVKERVINLKFKDDLRGKSEKIEEQISSFDNSLQVTKKHEKT